MQIDGYGGRGGNHDNETLEILKGRLFSEWPVTEPMPWRNCANRKCAKLFRPRAEGDDYCSELCDLDSSPKFKSAAGDKQK